MSSYQRNAILVTLLCSAGIFFLTVVGYDRSPETVMSPSTGVNLTEAIRNAW